MTDTKQVMQQALDALCLPCDRWNGQQAKIINAAIEALRGCLAAPAAEPEAMTPADVHAIWISASEKVPHCDRHLHFALDLIAARDAQWQPTRLRSGVPEGFALVPLKPTEEMRSAGKKQVHGESGAMTKCDRMWKAMLTAAPQAPALDAGVVRDAWRLLETGDRIESADEVLHDDCVTWGSLVGWEVGATYNTTLFMPIRRKVLAAMSAQGGA